MLRIRSRVATTHPIAAYDGFRLGDDQVHQIAQALEAETVPMQYNHDLARPSSAVVVAAGVEPTDDGYLAAWVEFDVDEDEWQRFKQECLAMGAPGGMSFSIVGTFANRGEPPYDLKIAADASYFDDDLLTAAAREALPDAVTVELARLYQFAWIPEPRVVIDIAEQILMSIPGNVFSSYLYDLASRFRARLLGHSSQPVFELRVRRTPACRSTKIKLVVKDDDELRRVMQEVPEILRVEAQAAYWDSTAVRWRQIYREQDEGEDQTGVPT
jgi:hypothetical protein